tara:strand:+ start:5598 stop:5921 length:324 start_codon:yes stop_codon:yes gene_type:complete
MKQTINSYQFIDEFRSIRPNNFSYEGLNALYDWFEEYEESTGEEVELDVIATCCEFTEFESLKEFQENYGDIYKTIEDIEYQTVVIPVKCEHDSKGCHIKSFIIQNF